MRIRASWDSELRGELNRRGDLIHATCSRIVQETLNMEDVNGRKCLEKHLPVRLARAGLVDMHGLGLRDLCEWVVNGVYRIGLGRGFEGTCAQVEGGERDLWLDVKSERSPGFGRDSVGLTWRTHGQTGTSTEYARRNGLG